MAALNLQDRKMTFSGVEIAGLENDEQKCSR